ncbi:TRAP transporter small permease subunit [Xanthobacteraceae bacterium Astr-EGSB]|uniref:TRAP transporter small permease n=1 Tax=Astrobacterium formosum TaxID=3069710 RepID=UPI0027AEEFAD|nr:TRAP transporter small permease subunit [Xanthobacteraceae bacterium Astr-EGSB]
MRSRFTWALQRLQTVVDALAVALFLSMFVLVLASVAMRAAGDPLIWGDELTRYLFVWVALLAWSIATRRGSHIRIQVLVDMLPPGARFGLAMVSHVAVLVFATVLVVQGMKMTARNLDIETITLFFTFAVVYAAAPVAGVLVALETARHALDDFCQFLDAEAGR